MCRVNASSQPLKVTNFLITEKCDAHIGSVLQALVSGLPPDRAACCKAKTWNAWTMSVQTGHRMTDCVLLVSFKSFQ